MHPSMEDDDGEQGIEDFLPEGVTSDQAEAVVDALVTMLEKEVALYPRHVHLAVSPDPLPEVFGGSQILIHGVFTFGRLAFSDRVQDPEQAKFNEQFRRFETDETTSIRDDILGDFLRDDK